MYTKGGRDFHNRSNNDIKGNTAPPSASSTLTRNQSIHLATFLNSTTNPTSASVSASTQISPINPSLSSASLQYFLVNLQGSSFWPVFFLTYTIGWESFVVQLVVVVVLFFGVYPLRMTNFWFHFSVRGQTHGQRKLWFIAEISTKIDMLEYRYLITLPLYVSNFFAI